MLKELKSFLTLINPHIIKSMCVFVRMYWATILQKCVLISIASILQNAAHS